MSIKITVFLALLLLPAAQRAQYAEVGINGGGTNFIGDVGNYGVHLPQGYMGGAFFRYSFDRRWSIRGGGNYGTIANDDAMSTMDYRRNRNLSFRSSIWEGYVLMEFNYRQYEPGSKYWHTPYLLGGIGIFGFNPEARYEGEWHELQPLGTEGQGTGQNDQPPYARASRFVLFGLGYKFALTRKVSLGIETTFRSTVTDYLDDVSGRYPDPELLREQNGELAAALSDRSLQDAEWERRFRGDPTNDDWYIFTGVTLQVKFESFVEKCANFVGN